MPWNKDAYEPMSRMEFQPRVFYVAQMLHPGWSKDDPYTHKIDSEPVKNPLGLPKLVGESRVSQNKTTWWIKNPPPKKVKISRCISSSNEGHVQVV